MANKKQPDQKKKPRVQTEKYNIETLHEDREYGMFWYAWLWKVIRPILIFLCAVLIVIGIVSFGYRQVYEHFFAPINANDPSVVKFEIEEGSSVTAIGHKLEEEQLINSGTMFRYMIQFRGLTQNLHYGTFELSRSMDLNRVVNELTNGSQTNERAITIIPGWTCEDIAGYLVREGILETKTEFLTLCNSVDLFVGDSYALKAAQDAGALEGRKYALEGYLAPDTYRVFRNASPHSLISTLLLQHNSVIDEVYYSTDSVYNVDAAGEYIPTATSERTLTMDGYIILASMIEKEAGKTEDFPKVSAVFHNRLKRGMKLESDPTATYTFGLKHYILTQQEMSDNNLYNTYVVDGLPVGPICNPSKAALQAAIYPDPVYVESGYLYFCATDPGTGELAFATTKEEHLENVQKYQALWVEYDNAHRD